MDGMFKVLSAIALLIVSFAPLARAQEQLPAPMPANAGQQKPRILTLAAAESLALNYNSRLLEARARYDQARGQAMQATLYPNPRFDGGNPQQLAGSSSVYSGGVSQEIVVAGKLSLDGAAANRAV